MSFKGYDWGGFTPYDHQARELAVVADRPAHACLWEMRTGKTPAQIHNAAYLFAKGEIEAMLVICPNYLKSEWRNQFAEHAPDWLDFEFLVWDGSKRVVERLAEWKAEPDGAVLRVLAVNEEAVSRKRGQEQVTRFAAAHETMGVIDEATSMANPKAKRTKFLLKLRPLLTYRRILTGTPVTKGPLDMWAPFHFLDPSILGYPSYYAMRNCHAMMGGFHGKEILGYVDVASIQKRIEPHSSRVLRSDVRDMPPKVYQKIVIPKDTNPEQVRVYEQMRQEMLAQWEGKELEALSVLAQMTRLSQITGGFLPHDESDGAEALPGPNPKIDIVVDLARKTDEKIVIFSRFRAELAALAERLGKEFGEGSYVEYHGGIKSAKKDENKAAFMGDPEVRFFIANQTSARMGLDLSAANLVIYMTNSFALLDRTQTEDRTETIKAGDLASTTYMDLVLDETLDETVLRALAAKQSLSDVITGDTRLHEWI